MLSSIKEKLLSVKRNVNLFNTEEKPDKNDKSSINYFAGAEILSKYQEQWAAIHKLNEENATKAEDLAYEIQNISKHVKSEKEDIGLITHILTQSNLTANISNCLKQVKNLHDTCNNVEKGLIALEDLINLNDFENIKKQHAYHLKQYEVRKQESLGSFKTNLETDHQKKILKHEANKKKILEERQKVFQEAFKSDLEVYKNLGTIPKLKLPKKQSALLEEIQLDFDQNELDQFFGEKSTL
ncbi:unnamed protein product [Brassicogethes aeneus]|uniref:Dysbindin-like protein n=1 Tax=Brassicogethes aeneus TaxID=1431903 RepID=A0A9P0AQT7_BRAAE|nr:unnamed protein product [Brassicogethes aeneus]